MREHMRRQWMRVWHWNDENAPIALWAMGIDTHRGSEKDKSKEQDLGGQSAVANRGSNKNMKGKGYIYQL